MSGPHPDPLDPLQALEPAALTKLHISADVWLLDVNGAMAMSAAISLKRIADALSGDNVYALNTLMENAGQAFAIGMRGR